MAVVTVFAEGRTEKLFCDNGATLKDVLTGAKIYVDAPCGGNGKCGKCIVGAEGNVSVPSAEELRLLGGRPGRLACMAKVTGDCVVTVFRGEKDMEVSLGGSDSEREFSPLRRGGLGAAVDIGTTTVVCRLFDMDSGRELGAKGALNLQRSFGADVISRIGACVGNPEARTAMTDVIRGQLREMLSVLSDRVGRGAEEIHTLVVAGNTTMCHLFAGLDPSGLAASPFVPESLFGESFKAEAASIGISAGAEVYILPAASAFVGGDITAAVLAAGLDRRNETELLVDIGTNGEIVLSHEGSFFCCAAAAGPAFEGADISCGMGGTEGAIRSVRMENGVPVCEVIGGGEARGICGSGLVDALAVMLSLGAVEPSGRMLFPDEAEGDLCGLLDENDDGEAFFRISENVGITAGDVRKLQLAKAAISAGARTLVDRAGVPMEQVSRLYIAGGFGNNVNVKNAGAMGLIPPELTERAVSVGNAAAEGACGVLCSKRARVRAEELCKKLSYVELSSDPGFMEHYVGEMFFGEE